MKNIKILYDSRNYTIVHDTLTNIVWLYSYQKPIAYFDIKNVKIEMIDKSNWTQTNKFHFSNWKKFLGIEK